MRIIAENSTVKIWLNEVSGVKLNFAAHQTKTKLRLKNIWSITPLSLIQAKVSCKQQPLYPDSKLFPNPYRLSPKEAKPLSTNTVVHGKRRDNPIVTTVPPKWSNI